MKLRPDGSVFSAVLLALIVFFVVLPIGACITCTMIGEASDRARDASNSAAARTACNTIRDATLQWMALNPGRHCPTVDALKTSKVLGSSFSALDPWGRAFDVRCTDDEIVCRSAGPDRASGTTDDIVVPSP